MPLLDPPEKIGKEKVNLLMSGGNKRSYILKQTCS